jgi:hypothetical protein
MASGQISSTKVVREISACTVAVTSDPATTHTIHDGKYEPRILKEGEWEHPVSIESAAENNSNLQRRISRDIMDELVFVLSSGGHLSGKRGS